MLVTVITVILALSFLVFVHELGHFLAAKKVGVHVIEFSIGFPPKVFSKVIGKTEYLISLIPIGGYVRLKGQGIEDEDENDPENYASKTSLQRFFILVSGALMNLAVTLVFLPLVFFIGYEAPAYLYDKPEVGEVVEDSTAYVLDIRKNDLIVSVNDQPVGNWKQVQNSLSQSETETITLKLKRDNIYLTRQFNRQQLSNPEGLGWRAKVVPIVGSISADSPAEAAGLKAGDLIVQLNSTAVDQWSQISPIIQETNGRTISVLVDRNGEKINYEIKPDWEENQKYWVLGIGSRTIRVSENIIDSVSLGFQRAYFLTSRTFEFLFRLITGKEKSDSVGGPIMIGKMIGEAAKTSVSSLLTLVAFISLQFAIFNLLPIPALDGGHIFFLLIEAITGKTLSKNLRMSIQRIGFSLLLLLILYISVQDGIRLFNG